MDSLLSSITTEFYMDPQGNKINSVELITPKEKIMFTCEACKKEKFKSDRCFKSDICKTCERNFPIIFSGNNKRKFIN